jgi:sulfur carrier protein ThiS
MKERTEIDQQSLHFTYMELASCRTYDDARDLLNELELSAQTIVSKQNGELVIEDTIINDDDEIQLVQIIYGG